MTSTCGADNSFMQPFAQLKDTNTPRIRQPHFRGTSHLLGNNEKSFPVTNRNLINLELVGILILQILGRNAHPSKNGQAEDI